MSCDAQLTFGGTVRGKYRRALIGVKLTGWAALIFYREMHRSNVWGIIRVVVLIPLQDYKTLHVAVVIWATKINTQTDRQLLTGCRQTSPQLHCFSDPHQNLSLLLIISFLAVFVSVSSSVHRV